MKAQLLYFPSAEGCQGVINLSKDITFQNPKSGFIFLKEISPVNNLAVLN